MELETRLVDQVLRFVVQTVKTKAKRHGPIASEEMLEAETLREVLWW